MVVGSHSQVVVNLGSSKDRWVAVETQMVAGSDSSAGTLVAVAVALGMGYHLCSRLGMTRSRATRAR